MPKILKEKSYLSGRNLNIVSSFERFTEDKQNK